MPNEPLVSIIVPVYNDSAALVQCLRALKEQVFSRGAFDIIVVDNGSDDDIASVIDLFPSVRFEKELTPGSYAARNKGISVAKGYYLAFTDADCKAQPRWLESGVRALQEHSNAGLVAGAISFTFRKPERPTAVELYDRISALDQRRYVSERGYGATANLFSRKSVFDNVGLFNSSLKSGGDSEWGHRVRDSGYLLVYSDTARVLHPARSSLRTLLRKAARVTGGHVQRMLNTSGTTGAVFADIASGFVPPVRRVFGLAFDARVPGFSNKLKVAAIMYLVKLVWSGERLRLIMGGSPRRC